ncbi:MAG TPA: hypothetical protein DCY26_10100 [Hyphomonas sp.]|nr:hypothetical protein [Hyphomonas sp.]
MLESADGRRVTFVREPVNSFLNLFTKIGDADWREVKLDFTQRSKLHFEHAFVHDGRFFFLAYNVELSVPAGRRLSGLREGLDLFEVLFAENETSIAALPDARWSAGLEAAVFHTTLNDRTVVCAALDCQEMRTSDGSINLEPIPLILPDGSSHRIAELSGSDDAAFVLVQREHDDRLHGWPRAGDPTFYVCELKPTTNCVPHLSQGTPWNLEVIDGKARYQIARSAEEYASLLSFDLRRLRQTGVATMMENNLEGRVAWSSVYYLNGMISLAADEPNLGAPFMLIADDARIRLSLELGYWGDALKQSYPGFQSKRYAMDREPLLSVLHLGRIVRVLERADSLLQIGPAQEMRARLVEIIRPSAETLEYISRQDGGRTELRIHKYSPFWADGTNVPWNYQSGWIDGLAALDEEEIGEAYALIVSEMLSQFISDEKLLSMPDDWNYSGGDTFIGWAPNQLISSNTPSWKGDRTNTQTAHISYRTMDVMALLSADRVGYSFLPAELKSHLLTLIDRGRVWPFAMEEARRHDHVLALEKDGAQLFARTVHPYDLQSQVWAISVLIDENASAEGR